MVVSVEPLYAANVRGAGTRVGRGGVPGGPKHDSTGLVWAASRHNGKVEPYLVRIDSALGLELPRMGPTLEIVGLALVALLLLALALEARQRRERERQRREQREERRKRREVIVAQRLAELDPEIPE